MKLYLVQGALPYFVAKQDEAKRDARNLKCKWEQVEVPTADGREALASFLNTLGGPASVQILGDEGEDEHVPVLLVEPKTEQPSYVSQSLKLEDEWDKLSLAHQLHFAALAMERAREAIA